MKNIKKQQEISDKIKPILEQVSKLIFDISYLKEFEEHLQEKIDMNMSAAPIVMAYGGDYELNIKQLEFYLKRVQALINLIEILIETEISRKEWIGKKEMNEDILKIFNC